MSKCDVKFENSFVPSAQSTWLDRAIGIMAKKYWIDINWNSISHKECQASESCLLKPFLSLSCTSTLSTNSLTIAGVSSSNFSYLSISAMNRLAGISVSVILLQSSSSQAPWFPHPVPIFHLRTAYQEPSYLLSGNFPRMLSS